MAREGTHAQAWTVALTRRAGARLGIKDQAAIESLLCTRRSLPPGAHFAHEGDRPSYCALVTEGTLYESKITQDGAQQIVGLRLQGEFVGLPGLLLHHADTDIQALTACSLIEIGIADMRRIITERPILGQILLADALVSCSIAQDWILNVGRRNAHSRVAHFLCELALRIEGASLRSGATFRLPLRQREFGDAVGLGRVAVNRMLGDLVDGRVIALDRGRVTILDADRLEEAGGFSARYLHLGQSPHDRRRTDRTVGLAGPMDRGASLPAR